MNVPLHTANKIPRTSLKGLSQSSGNIAAIDFGTTFCSLAYCTSGVDETIKLLTFDGDCHERVPNAVLIHRDHDTGVCKVLEFGYRAHNSYTKMRATDRINHIYFARIKPLLWKDEELHRESTVESFNKNKFYLVEVIAFILSYLKQRFEDYLEQISKGYLKSMDFDWVITVPAIWRARGKRMMREAAYMAGLLSNCGTIEKLSDIGQKLDRPNEINGSKLSLALEPESAAIYCQKDAIINDDSKPIKYLVIDLGGGTLDVTAHNISNGKVDVLVTPLGRQCGGTCVNEEFKSFFSTIVDDMDFNSFLCCDDSVKAITHCAALNDFIFYHFEEGKINFGESVTSLDSFKDGNGFDNEITLSLPSSIIKHYGEDRIRMGTDPLPGIHYDSYCLYITYYQMANIFQSTIDILVKCITCAFDRLQDNDINTIYLVGGFGGCSYIHYKIKEWIKDKYPSNTQYQVIVPKLPNVAIALGAVLWRRHHNVIRSRCSDATYGIGATIPFVPIKHDPYYKIIHPETSEIRCRNVFSVFLQIGEVISHDVVLQASVVPHRSSHDSLTVAIYCTEQLGVQYIKDKKGQHNVQEIGQIVVNISNPNDMPREERKVCVVLDFSGTEIQAKAKYSVTGEEFETVCDFLTALKCL